MAFNRDLSQFAAYLDLDAAGNYIGITSQSETTNVGIGTASPTSKLQVQGDVLISGITTSTGGFVGDLTGNADTASALQSSVTISLEGDVAGSVVFDGSSNVSISATIQPNSVALGDDTTGNYVATIADAGNTNITVNNSGTENAEITLDLTDTTVSAGSYGSASEIPTFTVDAKGRLTAAGTAPVSTGMTVTGDSGSEDIDLLTESLSISGGTNLTSVAANNGVTVNLDDDISLNSVVATGIVTASDFHTGAEGSAIRVTSDTISGPATLTIDPAAVGDDTGTVVIKGDLQVDGTQTIINSTTITVNDKNIQIADGAANDAAADGAGITVNSGDGDKTFQFNDANDSFQSNISLDVASGEVYKVDGTEVLSADTLGSGVVNSSLTSVGTLGQLEVSGVSTFSSSIDANGDLDVDGQTELDDLNVSGISTFASDVDINASVDISTNLNVAGVTTSTGGFVGDLTGNADTATTLETSRTFEITGDVVATAISFDGSGNVSLAATIQPNSVALGDDTTGNYVATIADAGNTNITVNNSGTETADVTLDLADTTVSAGSYGSATEIPTFTVDAKGRLTAAGTAAVSTGMTVAGDSGEETIDLLSEKLTIAGGTNLTSSAASDTVTINLDENISLTNVNASGVVTASSGFVGDVTGNADTATALETARTFEITGDVVGSAISFDGTGNVSIAATIQPNSVALGDDTTGNYVATIADAGNTNITVNNSGTETADVTLDLTDTAVSAGSYGSGSEIPTFTVDAKGRLTAAGTVAVSTGMTVAGDSGEETIDLLSEKLTIAGGTNLTSSAASDTVTVDLDNDINLDNINATGIVTAAQFVTGASGEAIGINTNTISGPETLILDPAAVGDNTGTVVIKGDLQVDGTQTIINSTTITVNDKNIQIADGAANDAAADGAGLTVNSGDGDKTFQFVDANDSFQSNISLDVASGKTYKIDGTEVLSADTLGSGVVNSSLTSVGTLNSLNVSGVSTFSGAIDADAGADIAGQTELDDVNVSGVATVNGRLTANGGVDLSGGLEVDQLLVTGVTTSIGGFEGDLTGNADTATALETSRTFEITGDVVATAVSFDGTGNVSFAATIQPNSVALGDDTTGNYVATIADSGNSDVVVNNSGTETAAVTLGLTDTTVSAGSYGSATEIPTFTVDAKGRLTAAGTAAVSTGMTVAGDSGSETIDLLSETLTIAGGTNLTSSAASDTVTINLDENISLTNVNASGVVTASSGFVGDLTGDVTGNADTATALETARTFDITGDVVATAVSFDGTGNVSFAATIQPNSVALGDDTTGNYVATIADAGNTNITVNNSGTETADVTLDLTDTTVSAGSYGSATEIPTFTVDAKGRLTAAGTAAVSTGMTVAGDSGSETIDLLSEQLTIAGDTHVTTAAASDTVTISVDATSENTNNTIVARDSSGGFSAGIITASQVLLGAEGSALQMKSDRITGPATIILDPAAVGDDTGVVVIKGDLQVDGTQTIINSTTITVNDKNIQIADGAANDAAADGAGLTVNSGDGDKTFQFVDANDSFQANIALDVTSGNVYKVNGTEVLSADTLGSGVVNSSLTSVGTLNSLNVSGVSTFSSDVDVNASVDISSNLKVAGVTTSTGGFVGDLTGDVTGNADTATALETARTLEITGDVVATAVSFDGTGNVSFAATIQPNSVALGDDTTGNYVATIADAGNTNITVNNSGTETADVTLDLTNTTVSAGSYGSSTEIPTFTVDEKGRLTAAGTAAVGTALTVAGDSGSEIIDLLSESLTIAGGTNLTSSAASDTVTINLDENISLTNVNASGVVTASSGFVGDVTGNADTATALETSRTFEITGDVVATAVSFDGTGNVSFAATIQPNSVALGDDTTGNYVATIADSGNSDVVVNNSGTETADVTLGLTDTTVSAGSYGSSTEIPTFTVDAKGRLTAAGTAAVGTALTVAGDSGSEVINLLSETLTIAGGTNLTSSAASDTLTLDLDSDINLDNINATGIITAAQFVTGASGEAIGINTNTISGPETLILDPAAVGDNTGLVVIKGDLQVDGTQTIINSTTVTIEDKNIQIADGAANDAAADGAGLTVNSGDGNKTFQFSDANDSFQANIALDVTSGNVYKVDGTEVLSADTLGSGVVNSSLTSVGTLGQLEVTGVTTSTGGFDGDLTGNADTATALETSRTFEITGDVVATAVSFDGTGNVSFAATIQPNSVALGDDTTGNYVATIADAGNTNITVNNSGTETADVTLDLTDTTVSAGSYGSSTEIPTFTVDSKGRLTAAGTAAVGTALTVAGDSGSEVINLLSETLTIAGGTNLTSSAASDTLTLDLDSDISLDNINATGIVTASSGFVGNVTGDVTGNLNSSGLSTVTNLEVGGYISAGSTTGTNDQVIISTGAGVTWTSIEDILPQTRTTDTQTATDGQTAFSFTYNVNYLDVFLNGVKLSNSDFTATNGSDITLSEGAFAGDKVEFVSYNTAGTGAGSVNSLNDLSDVSLGALSSGNILSYNGSGWVNTSTLSGITALDATTTATIESAVAAAPNDFTSLSISGVSTFTGAVDANGGADISGGLEIDTINASGIVTASAFYGDGSNLTGIDATALKDAGGSVIVQANESGAVVTGIITASNGFSGNLTGDVTGNADTATTLETARTIGLSGDVSGSASFDGSANVTIIATVSDDSHNHIISNVDGLQDALDLKAPLASPALTGTPTAPTAVSGTNSTQVATTEFVTTAVANVIDSAPGALDTLNELAAALGDDSNFSATVTNNLALKAPLASPALTGTPTAPTAAGGTNTTQVATTAFVASAIAGEMSGNAATATALETGRTIGGVSFDGTANIDLPGVNTAGNQDTSGNAATATAWETARDLSLTGDGTATLSSVDGTANVSGALTLATVNSNVGSFGDGGSIPTITVNAKGLITGVTTTAVVTGTTISDDTSTDSTFYPTFTSSTSGSVSAANVSSTKLTFNPSTGTLNATNVNSTSDANLKDNVKPVENASELVGKLEGVHFTWKENGSASVGVIAQQIEEHLPQLVYQGEEYKSVNYNGLVGVLIEAVKEQGAQIAALKAEIEELKK